MFRLHRHTVLLLALAGLILATSAGLAQPRPPVERPDTPGDLTPGINLPRDNRLKRQLEAARDYIKAEDWVQACEVLQKLLDIPEDKFADVTRTIGGKETTVLVSVKAEASRLLGALPAKGLDFYKRQYGPDADKLFKEYEATGDKQLLGDISRRFLHTDAGAEATRLLAVYFAEHEQYVVAGLRFEKLIERAGVEKLDGPTLFLAARTFRRVGDESNYERTWKQLEKVGKAGIKIDGKVRTLDELRDELRKITAPGSTMVPGDWLLFRGNASRSGQAEGGAPFLEATWRESLVREEETKTWVKKALDALEGKPILSAAVPITATVKKQSLVIYRSQWGIHATDLKTGKIFWESPSTWSLDRMLRDNAGGKRQVITNWLNAYVTASGRPEVLFDNSVVSTLSSDGRNVYAVENLPIPPFVVPGFGPAPAVGKEVEDALHHSRLQAYDLESGKLIWEVGQRIAEKNDKSVLDNAHFLAPPLPLDKSLYVPLEKKQALHLVKLDPKTGKQLGEALKLLEFRDELMNSPARRMRAVHLASAEGMVVCAVPGGSVVGVDLLDNRLVWAFNYDRAENKPVRPGFPPRPVDFTATWQSTAPLLIDGKVLVAPSDGASLHCLSLRDGSRQWKVKRHEKDLYFAGVVAGKALIVGNGYCRAVNLADGKETWRVETGTPSGFGVAGKQHYYLPLRAGGGSKEPEVCVLDVVKGQVQSHIRSRGKDVPGNLIFTADALISQGVQEIVAFPLLQKKLDEIDQLLLKNPTDPQALFERGRLRLDKGDLKNAIHDFRLALRNMPAKDLELRLRQTLFDAMSEFLQRDFAAAEPLLGEYRELISATDPALPAEQRKAEERRRAQSHHRLVALGREQQGKRSEALAAYLDLLADAGDVLLPVPDEPGLETNVSVWAQSRITQLREKAAPAEREALDAIASKRLDKLRDGKEVVDLRQFVRAFASSYPAGREARLLLAERLLDGNDRVDQLEVERMLQELRHVKGDERSAGRAVELLGRLLARQGRFEDAVYYYEVLHRGFSKTIIRDGKTGADLYNDLATDKRFAPFLDRKPIEPPMAKLKATEERGSFPLSVTQFEIGMHGEDTPFLRRHRLFVRTDANRLRLWDSVAGVEVWDQALAPSVLAQLLWTGPQQNNVYGPPHLRAHAQGRVVVLALGSPVYALDVVEKRVLWERKIAGLDRTTFQAVQIDPRDGSMRITFADNQRQRLSALRYVNNAGVALATNDGLTFLDLLTGAVLWKRGDITGELIVAADDDHVSAVEMGMDGAAVRTHVLHVRDGSRVAAPDFTSLFNDRLHFDGRLLLGQEKGEKGATVLRLLEVATGKELWKDSLAEGAHVLRSAAEGFAGFVTRDGKVTVLELATQKVALRGTMNAEHLARVQSVALLRDRHAFYLACVNPPDVDLLRGGGVHPNAMTTYVLHSLPVNGVITCFDDKGGVRWEAELPNQMLVLDEFRDAPVLIGSMRGVKVVPGRPFEQFAALRVIDKRTGKLLFDQEGVPESLGQFHKLSLDAKTGTLEFTSHVLRLTIQPQEKKP